MDNNEPIVLEETFNSPAEKVWQALTDRDQMQQWYFEMQAFKPEVGFEFQFMGGDENERFKHLCQVTEAVPCRKLTYSWRYEGYEGVSKVSFELFPEGEKTRLRLTHSGLETFPATAPALARANFVAGWNEIIYSSLKNFLENTTIQKSIEIPAPPETVWDVLVNPAKNRVWNNVFSAGTYVETDWKKGSVALWKDNAGQPATKGLIEVSDFARQLKIAFFDDIEMNPPAPAGPYTETYTLTPTAAGTTLHVQAGPLPARIAESHGSVWETVLNTMKNLAAPNSGELA